MSLEKAVVHERHEKHENNRRQARLSAFTRRLNKLSMQAIVFVRVFGVFRGQRRFLG